LSVLEVEKMRHSEAEIDVETGKDNNIEVNCDRVIDDKDKNDQKRNVILNSNIDATIASKDDMLNHIMRDYSVKYNTSKLTQKSQKIYNNLPPIMSSIDINSVSNKMIKQPNKILLEKVALRKEGLMSEAVEMSHS
jgi:CRISPR/Cas system-associated endonuclease Cas3-HD